ncbi:MAG: molybdenum cofactor guanylyltransferase [Armatimonadota bacterium]|nr:molybdenum cofactor guanylyltransferase [Armatimonadota bacterium]
MTVLAELTGIVLAGGQSRRMGTDKAFVPIDGVPMIQRVVEALRTCCAEVVIVAKDRARYEGLGTRVVVDASPQQLPLVGLCSGLAAVTTPWAFAAACDLPFLSARTVRLLSHFAVGFDAAVPHVDGRWHPLHAVYAAAAAPALEGRLAAGVRRLHEALEGLRVRAVTADDLRAADPHLRTLANINTPHQHRASGKIR